MRALLLALALVGCASGSELADAELMGPFVLHEAEQCGMAFDPAPELARVTQRAAERWSAATGCDVRVEAGGVPLRTQGFIFAEELPSGLTRLHAADPQLRYRELCGATLWREDGAPIGIVIATADSWCDMAENVAHEMGHQLADRRGHAEGGLMADANESGRSGVIDAASLVWVCDNLACAALATE